MQACSEAFQARLHARVEEMDWFYMLLRGLDTGAFPGSRTRISMSEQVAV